MKRRSVFSFAAFFIAAQAISAWFCSAFAHENTAQICIPPHQFVELSPSIAGSQTDTYGRVSVALGSYERVSPDGRFILRSFSAARLGDVSLIEINERGQVQRLIETPLKNEAFPVQGSWRYLVDVNGDHYDFRSIASNTHGGQRPHSWPKPLFKGGMDGFYAAAAELPSPRPGHVRIRSLSWPNAMGDAQTQGEGALASRTIEMDTARARIVADSGVVMHCTQRVREDGPMYALPMISVDGQEFAALPQTPPRGTPTMRIYAFGADGRGCEARSTFEFSSGKTTFGFADPAKPDASAPLAWEYRGQAWWFSRELNAPFNIAPDAVPGLSEAESAEISASAFPGITRDGRVIYAVSFKSCSSLTPSSCRLRAGYIISDPYQSVAYQQFLRSYKGSARRQCITLGDVRREREAFAKFHGLSL